MSKESNVKGRLTEWWRRANGTGTAACTRCVYFDNTFEPCTWHAARLEDLEALIASEKLSVLDKIEHEMKQEGLKVSQYKQEVTFKSTVSMVVQEIRATLTQEKNK